jgi:putative phosphoesterase
MRVALISDIHGNDVALEAVLADARSNGTDQIVCLGDVATLGPSPNGVVKRLRDLGCTCIMGNHDEFLLEPDLIDKYTEIEIIHKAVDWCRSALTAKNLRFIGAFSRTEEIELCAGQLMLVYHGSPGSHMEGITPGTGVHVLEQYLDGGRYAVMAGGHTHVPMVRRYRGAYFVNPGSVGEPFYSVDAQSGPRLMEGAEYAIVDCTNGRIGIELRRIPVDTRKLLDILRGNDNPLAGWLIGEYEKL